MMFDILIYGAAVALLFSLAGLAIEQIAVWRGWARRGIWVTTMVASLVLPAVMVTRPHPLTAVSTAVASPMPAVPKTASPPPEHLVVAKPAAIAFIPVPIIPLVHRYSFPSFDKVCQLLWGAMSAGLFGCFAFAWGNLHQARRRWRREVVDGLDLWVTPALGPAVLGFFKPQILVPQWILQGPVAIRSVVLAHENEHIQARDPLLLLTGFLVLLVLPWNPLLWWQLRRVRFAVEVDCDTRVLGRVADIQTYADALLAVNQRGALAPFGAMAIAARTSQLERRVRIMTSLRRSASRWIIGAALGLGVACVAIAVDLNAPRLGDSDLTRPPLHDWSPFLPKAEAAARAAYPQLFQGAFSGSVELHVDMTRDGGILDIRKMVLPVGQAADDTAAPDVESVDWSEKFVAGFGTPFDTKFIGWFGPDRKNGLYVSYQVYKWPPDPTRSAARVRAAVAAQYPEFFQPYGPIRGSQPGERKLLTVFMNEDGTINREMLSDNDGRTTGSEKAEYQLFLKLGLTPEQFARRACTTNIHNSPPYARYPDESSLMICYAWPRRSDDPPDEVFQSRAVFKQAEEKRATESHEQVPDEAFLERYFPDIWGHGPAFENEDLWILFDHQGRVWDVGRSGSRSPGADIGVLAKELEAKYPGTKINLDLARSANTADGHSVYMEYFRLDADSPVTERASIDYSKRRDLLLVVDECRGDIGCGSVPYLMDFGTPVLAWIGGLQVQLTAADAGSGFVDLQLRRQATDGTVQNVSSNWQAAGNPVHIADGGRGSVELVDQYRVSWHIVLKPRRLKP